MRQYRYGRLARLVNIPFLLLGARGLGNEYRHVLTVRGRRSGKPHSLPVDVMAREGRRYLVAGYGVTSWVANARAAGEVELQRGRRRERAHVRELLPDEAGPILRQYVEQVPVVRGYFSASRSDPAEAFVSEAEIHPVFELVEAQLLT